MPDPGFPGRALRLLVGLHNLGAESDLAVIVLFDMTRVASGPIMGGCSPSYLQDPELLNGLSWLAPLGLWPSTEETWRR